MNDYVELNIQIDHVHLLAMVPPKISISDYVEMIKGRTVTQSLNLWAKIFTKQADFTMLRLNQAEREFLKLSGRDFP